MAKPVLQVPLLPSVILFHVQIVWYNVVTAANRPDEYAILAAAASAAVMAALAAWQVVMVARIARAEPVVPAALAVVRVLFLVGAAGTWLLLAFAS
jgi:hypothetical protein